MDDPGGPDVAANASFESLLDKLRNHSSSQASQSLDHHHFTNQQHSQNNSQFAPPAQQHQQPFYYGHLPTQLPPAEQQYHHLPQHGYQPPTVSSPVVDPQPSISAPHHASAVISPNVATPVNSQPDAPSSSKEDRTTNLLNLLKFTQPTPSPLAAPSAADSDTRDNMGSAASRSSRVQGESQAHGRALSASDLVASFLRKSSPASQTPPTASPVTGRGEVASTSQSSDGMTAPVTAPTNPQELLLQLLNRPKPTQGGKSRTASQDTTPIETHTAPRSRTQDSGEGDLRTGSFQEKEQSPSPRVFGNENEGPSIFNPQQAEKSSQGIFTYVNPFEQLSASSPRNRTPRPASSKRESGMSPALLEREGNKRFKMESASPTLGRSASQLSSRAIDAESTVSSPTPAKLPDGRTPLMAMLGIGVEKKDSESVAEALNEITMEADREANKALAEIQNLQGQGSAKNGENTRIIKEELEETEKTCRGGARAKDS